MMTLDEALNHGSQWIAAGWTWDRGQVALVFRDGAWVEWVVPGPRHTWPMSFTGVGMVPDMRNRGTRGHALGQARDAWGSPGLYVAHDEPSLLRRGGPEPGQKLWRLENGSGHFADERYASEAEALLAARRLAP